MYKKGTIVLVPFPFTDLSGSKVRPALIVGNPGGNDVILLFVSSRVVKSGKHEVILKPTALNGLKTVSVVNCAKIATLEKKIILGELGTLSSNEKKSIDVKLRQVFHM